MVKRDTLLLINIMSNFVFRFVGLSLSFFAVRFLVESVGVERYGIFLLSSTLLGYFALANVGLPGALLKYVPEYIVKKDFVSLNRVVSSAYIFYILMGLVTFLILGSFSLVGQSLFKISPENHYIARNVFLMVGLWAIVSWPMEIYTQILMGAQRFYLFNISQGIQILICNILYIIVGLSHLSIEFAVLAFVFSQLIFFSINHFIAHKIIPELKVSLRFYHLDTLKMLFSFSVWIMIMGLAGLIIYQSDQLVISVFLSVGLVSIYTVQATPLMGVRMIYGMILSTLIPAVSDSKARNDKMFVEEILFRGSRLSFSAISSLMIVIMAMAYPLIYVWMGERFADYSYLCVMLLACYIIASATGVVGQILIGMGEVKILGIMALANAVINIILSLIFVQSEGIIGVVMGTFLAQIIMTPLAILFIFKKLEISFFVFFRKVLLRIYMVSFIFFFVWKFLSDRIIVHPRFRETLLLAGAGVAVTFVANLFFACEKEDRNKIKSFFRDFFRILGTYMNKSQT